MFSFQWRKLQKSYKKIAYFRVTVKIFRGLAPSLKATYQSEILELDWVPITIWHNFLSDRFFSQNYSALQCTWDYITVLPISKTVCLVRTTIKKL